MYRAVAVAVCFCLCAAVAYVVPDTDTHRTVLRNYGPETVDNFAGYISVHNKKRHLFYWFFESRNAPSTDPFVVWFTGGPGCSSLVALFYENGPYHINNETLDLTLNNFSWNTKANILFIDQPVGAGFSYADEPDIGVLSEKQMAEDMYEFFQIFMSTHSKYQSQPFYVFGESYAGHYVPAFSARVLQGNKAGTGIHINLNGSAIGNGLVDPPVQYGAYADFLLINDIIKKAEYDVMKAALPACELLIAGCKRNPLGLADCIAAVDVCNAAEVLPFEATGLNVYDIRIPCEKPPLCYDFSPLEKLVKTEPFKSGVNATGTWNECNRETELKLVLAGDWMQQYEQDIPLIIESGARVMIYAGEDDFICNYLGNERWVEKLDWSGHDAYNKAANKTWVVDGKTAGSTKTADGLTFVRVAAAGHMVPMNQPKNSLSMMLTFLSDGW